MPPSTLPPYARATPEGLVLDEPPPGLLDGERDWIEGCARLAGGLTEAFCALVRLRILGDTVETYYTEKERMEQRAGRARASCDARRRRVREWAQARAAHGLEPRWHNLMAWCRPGQPGGHGQAGVDDPATPLPAERVRRLIVEGRAMCDRE